MQNYLHIVVFTAPSGRENFLIWTGSPLSRMNLADSDNFISISIYRDSFRSHEIH